MVIKLPVYQKLDSLFWKNFTYFLRRKQEKTNFLPKMVKSPVRGCVLTGLEGLGMK
jgi:hypothetical protein